MTDVNDPEPPQPVTAAARESTLTPARKAEWERVVASEAVLADLDAIARGVDRYEYGLPLYDGAHCERMTEVVAKAIRDAVRAETERCANVARVAADAVLGHAGHGYDEYTLALRIEELIREGVAV